MENKEFKKILNDLDNDVFLKFETKDVQDIKYIIGIKGKPDDPELLDVIFCDNLKGVFEEYYNEDFSTEELKSLLTIIYGDKDEVLNAL